MAISKQRATLLSASRRGARARLPQAAGGVLDKFRSSYRSVARFIFKFLFISFFQHSESVIKVKDPTAPYRWLPTTRSTIRHRSPSPR